MRSWGHRVLIVVLGLSLGLVAPGCEDSGGGGDPTFPVIGENEALLRVAHLSPDAGTVDVTVTTSAGETIEVSDAEFGDVTGFRPVTADFDGVDVTVRVVAGGNTVESQFELLRGDVITVAALGKLVPVRTEVLTLRDGSKLEVLSGADAFRIAALPTQIETTASETTIGFVHAAPKATAVRVTITGGSEPGLFDDLEFGQRERAVRIAQDRYDLQLKLVESGDVVLSFDDLLLRAGTAYTLWAIERPDGEISAVLTRDEFVSGSQGPTLVTELQPATSSLRVANFAAPEPALGFVYGGRRVNLDGSLSEGTDGDFLAFRQVSEPADIVAATKRLVAFDADATPDTIGSVRRVFGSDTSFTYVAFRNLANTTVTTLVSFTGADPPVGSAAVRLGNLARSSPPRQFALRFRQPGTQTTIRLATVNPFTVQSAFESIPAGTWDLELLWLQSPTSTPVLLERTVELAAGDAFTFYAHGNTISTAADSLDVFILDENATATR